MEEIKRYANRLNAGNAGAAVHTKRPATGTPPATRRSLVDHDFAEHGTEQPRPAVLDAPRLDVDVAAAHRLGAGDVQTRLQQRVVESRQTAADVRRLVDLTTHTHTHQLPVQRAESTDKLNARVSQ